MIDRATIERRVTRLQIEIERLQQLLPQPMPSLEDQREELIAKLLAACERNHYRVDFDGAVNLKDAAALLDLQPATLKRQRERFPPEPGHKCRYRLLTLVDDLLRQRSAD